MTDRCDVVGRKEAHGGGVAALAHADAAELLLHRATLAPNRLLCRQNEDSRVTGHGCRQKTYCSSLGCERQRQAALEL